MRATTATQGRWGPGRIFLLGLGLGGVAAAFFWHFYPGFWQEPAAAPASAVERRAALQVQVQRAVAPPPAQAAPRGACAFEPLIPPGSAADGRVRIEHPFPAGPRAKAKVFLRTANRAMASGRPRDAEVALIAACRFNAEASARPTVPLARVLGLLGDGYLAAAARETPPGLREALLARAQEVLALSAETYAQALGPNAARSRAARQRVAALADGLIDAVDAPPPKEPGHVTTALRPRVEQARAAPPAAPAVREQARSSPGPIPPREAADPALRQLAADLERLRAQAEAVSEDPAGLRARTQRAEAERARCADAACLRDWYARRRQELLAEF